MAFDAVELLGRFFGVVLIDLILAGDNAVVIAMAARRLQGNLRRRAIVLGAGAAVLARLLFAAVVATLVRIPLLQAVGGALLLWIAWKLVQDDRGGHGEVAAAGSVAEAVRIIVLADVIMSLDNVLALVAVSEGHLPLLALGLALTVPLLIWGSTLISGLMDRWRVLVYAGAGILAWVAFGMILHDRTVGAALAHTLEGMETAVQALGTGALVAGSWWWTARRRRPGGESREAPAE